MRIWYCRATCKTGRILARALGFNHGSTVSPHRSIGWGAKLPPSGSFGEVVLNHPEKVNNCRNKLRALRLMKQAEVRIPKLYLSSSTDISFPVVARTTYHQKGQGFWFCANQTELDSAYREGATHALQWIDKQYEFRVHVFNGEIIRLSKKIRDRNQASHDELIWGHHGGWKFYDYYVKDIDLGRDDKRLPGYEAMAIKAVESLDLDFGAVDVVSKDRTAYVLEVNSAPSLEGRGLTVYINAIRRWLNNV